MEKKKTIPVLCFSNKKTKDTQPDYLVRVKLGSEFVECGAGWKKQSSTGTTFLSLSLDTEMLSKVYKEKYLTNSDGTPVPSFDKEEDDFKNF